MDQTMDIQYIQHTVDYSVRFLKQHDIISTAMLAQNFLDSIL